MQSTIKHERMKELDPLLHSQLRLAVMSILMNVEEADFVYLRQTTESTAGNLSVQLDKLADAGYIDIEKGFAGKKTRTVCRVTPLRPPRLRNLRRRPQILPPPPLKLPASLLKCRLLPWKSDHSVALPPLFHPLPHTLLWFLM